MTADLQLDPVMETLCVHGSSSPCESQAGAEWKEQKEASGAVTHVSQGGGAMGKGPHDAKRLATSLQEGRVRCSRTSVNCLMASKLHLGKSLTESC